MKVASGSCGNMFLGTYSGDEVAVKVLNPENLNQNACNEFKQEIYMEVDHPVRFSDSCTKPHLFFLRWRVILICLILILSVQLDLVYWIKVNEANYTPVYMECIGTIHCC